MTDKKLKGIAIYPFVISWAMVNEPGFTVIGLEFYKGETGKWTMSFVLLDMHLLISVL